ncbi:MAG: type II toxin-antitoxin system RelE/ParE family toxin [Alphaproteobacteria bacterium]|nr:type II toxin-antitoxin system RelE/ParE family toxin [Alphaproteobacteria bacterium]
MKIVYTPTFNKRILEIKHYLKTNYPHFLKYTQLQIEQKIETIAKNNHTGRIGRVKGTREVVFAKLPYCIVYEINETKQEIVILNIIHTSIKYP